jgi:acyl carrier protein
MMEVDNKLKEIIVEQLSVDEERIKAESSFIDDLGADSLDIVELVMTMEEKYDLEIPDEDAEGLKTVGDVISYLKTKGKIH